MSVDAQNGRLALWRGVETSYQAFVGMLRMPSAGGNRSRNGARRASLAIALALLVASGAGYRVAASRLGRSSATPPIPVGTLAKLPLLIADWRGTDAPLPEAVVRATATDDHVSRNYVRINQAAEVGLFVAHGVRMRDLLPHRPEVCYPGQGWTLEASDLVNVGLPEGSLLPCQIQRFTMGGLGTRRMTVLSYYLVNGTYCPDVSLLRSKAWRLDSAVAYAAQVQITCAGRGLRDTADDTVRAFAADSARAIRTLLVEAVAAVTAADGEGDG